MDNESLKYRKKFLKAQKALDEKFKAAFNKAADDISRLSKDPAVRFVKGFELPKELDEKAEEIIKKLNNKILRLTIKQIEYSWKLSDEKDAKR